MVATVLIAEATGGSYGSPSWATVTAVRLYSADTSDSSGVSTSNPVVIPAGTAGTAFNYSYWKHVALNIYTSPSTQITNIRHYVTWSNSWNWGTNGQIRRGNKASPVGCPTADYNPATGTSGTTGNSIEGSSGHNYYNGQSYPVADLTQDNSTNPATIDSTSYTTGSSTTYTYGVVLQVRISSDATQGAQTANVCTWMYDES